MSRGKSFYIAIYFTSQVLEYTSQALKHTSQGLGYTFQVLECKLLRGEKNFFVTRKELLCRDKLKFGLCMKIT